MTIEGIFQPSKFRREKDADASSAVVEADGTLTAVRYASTMAKTMGKDPVEITFTEGEPEMPQAVEDAELAPSYVGSYTSGRTEYTTQITFDTENGTYQYIDSFTMGDTTYTETESGTYTLNGNTLVLSGEQIVMEPDALEAGPYEAGVTTGTVEGDTLTVSRHVSIMAKTMGKDQVSLTLKEGEPAPEEPTEEPTQPSTEEPEKDERVRIVSAKDKNGEAVSYKKDELAKTALLTKKIAVEKNPYVGAESEIEILWQKDVTVPGGTVLPVTLDFEVSGVKAEQELYVYHYEDGDWKLVGTGKDGKVSTSLESFSPITVVAKNLVKAPANTQAPKTGDTGAVVLWACLTVCSAAAVLVLAKKRERF